MPIIRRLFGPFHRLIENAGKQSEEVRWHFFGIRDDYRMGHWTLIYFPFSRTWRIGSNDINATLTGRSSLALRNQGIDTKVSKTVVHIKAHLNGSPVLSGTITSILKKRITEKDLAFAIARSILMRR